MAITVNFNGAQYTAPGAYTNLPYMRNLIDNVYTGQVSKDITPGVMDHITADLVRVMYRLALVEVILVTDCYERMWDFDEMREVNDLIGYNVWHAE